VDDAVNAAVDFAADAIFSEEGADVEALGKFSILLSLFSTTTQYRWFSMKRIF